jgi:hypothetical protein
MSVSPTGLVKLLSTGWTLILQKFNKAIETLEQMKEKKWSGMRRVKNQ